MHISERTVVEEGLRELARERSASLTAFDVFASIANSLARVTFAEQQESGGDLLTAYVADVGKIWRRARLNPGRARHPEKPEYRSPFHIFLELVLIDHMDPRSRLFDHPGGEELDPARKVHASLPPKAREVTRIGSKHEWLISEHHLKTAKTAGLK
jgi:hypothetical protein